MSDPSTKITKPSSDIQDILIEVKRLVEANRKLPENTDLTIKDYRRLFDQESAKMNQAIFNDQHDQVRESCLRTVAILIELIARA